MKIYSALLLGLFIAAPSLSSAQDVMPAIDSCHNCVGGCVGDRDCVEGCVGHDLMDVRNYRLHDYRRMFMCGRAPTSAELQGTWRGVNKGLVRLVGLKQFVKEIQPCGSVMFGDNIDVHQVSDDLLRCCGWRPKVDRKTGTLKRNGKYMVKRPDFRGPFGHGVTFSYRDGGNRLTDFRRVIVDKVVVLDHDHLLGRASVRLGLLQVPVGYFVLERIY